MTKKQIYRFLHFLPFVAILGIITLIWYDPIVIILLIVLFPVTAILIASAVFAIMYGIKSGGAHAKAIIAMCAIDFIALVLLITIGTRDSGVDASKMNKYYQQAKKILAENRMFLVKLTVALVEKKMLTRKEIQEIRNSQFVK